MAPLNNYVCCDKWLLSDSCLFPRSSTYCVQCCTNGWFFSYWQSSYSGIPEAFKKAASDECLNVCAVMKKRSTGVEVQYLQWEYSTVNRQHLSYCLWIIFWMDRDHIHWYIKQLKVLERGVIVFENEIHLSEWTGWCQRFTTKDVRFLNELIKKNPLTVISTSCEDKHLIIWETTFLLWMTDLSLKL